jgi:hypothetical protein
MKGTEQLRDQAFALAHRSHAACLLCQSNCGSDSSVSRSWFITGISSGEKVGFLSFMRGLAGIAVLFLR